MSEVFDAIIVGAGPAGGAASLALSRAGWRVAVIEKAAFPRRKVCGEFLSATNRRILDQLGLLEEFDAMAGPPITETAVFYRNHAFRAPMPPVQAGVNGVYGRALTRQRLDPWLLGHAAKAGATVFHPAQALEHRRFGETGHEINVRLKDASTVNLRASLLIAAHGSWEKSKLPSFPHPQPPRPRDFLGFKAHFRHSQLPPELMPMLAFPGGYGGLVSLDQAGGLSLSCCVRRDYLERIRRDFPQLNAGESVVAHIRRSCRYADAALHQTEQDGKVLAAGPIRPGLRRGYVEADGIFRTGNAIGEAHPIIAEGISMALQGGWMIASILAERIGQPAQVRPIDLLNAGDDYTLAWRKSFAPRIRSAGLFAELAHRPSVARFASWLLAMAPSQFVGWGASLSGKHTEVKLLTASSA